jgi:DNA-directed RNA polymerase subunit RPC12/RpoP
MVDFYTCSFCGHRFAPEDSVVCCARCSLFGTGGCHKIRCPHCGYEMAPPPRLPGLIAAVVKRVTGKRVEK